MASFRFNGEFWPQLPVPSYELGLAQGGSDLGSHALPYGAPTQASGGPMWVAAPGGMFGCTDAWATHLPHWQQDEGEGVITFSPQSVTTEGGDDDGPPRKRPCLGDGASGSGSDLHAALASPAAAQPEWIPAHHRGDVPDLPPTFLVPPSPVAPGPAEQGAGSNGQQVHVQEAPEAAQATIAQPAATAKRKQAKRKRGQKPKTGKRAGSGRPKTKRRAKQNREASQNYRTRKKQEFQRLQGVETAYESLKPKHQKLQQDHEDLEMQWHQLRDELQAVHAELATHRASDRCSLLAPRAASLATPPAPILGAGSAPPAPVTTLALHQPLVRPAPAPLGHGSTPPSGIATPSTAPMQAQFTPGLEKLYQRLSELAGTAERLRMENQYLRQELANRGVTVLPVSAGGESAGRESAGHADAS